MNFNKPIKIIEKDVKFLKHASECKPIHREIKDSKPIQEEKISNIKLFVDNLIQYCYNDNGNIYDRNFAYFIYKFFNHLEFLQIKPTTNISEPILLDVNKVSDFFLEDMVIPYQKDFLKFLSKICRRNSNKILELDLILTIDLLKQVKNPEYEEFNSNLKKIAIYFKILSDTNFHIIMQNHSFCIKIKNHGLNKILQHYYQDLMKEYKSYELNSDKIYENKMKNPRYIFTISKPKREKLQKKTIQSPSPEELSDFINDILNN